MLKYYPPLVKESSWKSEYPGYSYTYFKNFKEIDIYFSENYGKDWKDSEWAKVWLNNWKFKDQEVIEPKSPSVNKKSSKYPWPRWLIRYLVLYYKDRKLSYRKISQELYYKHNIKLSVATIVRLLQDENMWKFDPNDIN